MTPEAWIKARHKHYTSADGVDVHVEAWASVYGEVVAAKSALPDLVDSPVLDLYTFSSPVQSRMSLPPTVFSDAWREVERFLDHAERLAWENLVTARTLHMG